MGIADFSGGRGEAIALLELMKFRPDGTIPYFWPRYLGEKNKTFDFLVELVEAGKKTPFFLAQVKSTQHRLTHRGTRLPIDVPAENVARMASYPAPVYLIGVQETSKRAFLISVHGEMKTRIRSISTAHELTCETLSLLWEEVRDYWRHRDMTRSTSRFLN